MTTYNDLLQTAHANMTSPALGGMVLRSNEIIWHNVIGTRRMDSDELVTPNDKFHIGSCAKAMTTTIAALLVERGQISWDTRPGTLYPTLPIIPAFQNITLQDLFQHQAGLPPFEEDEEFTDLPDLGGTPIEQRRRFAEYVLTNNDVREPGTYSNAGYGIATAMLETVSGRAWRDLLQQELFDPLGMTSAGFGWPATHDPDQPWGHHTFDGPLTPHPPDDEYQLPAVIAPAGDIHTNLLDYAPFLQLHLRGLRGQDGLLQAETIKHLHTPIGRNALGWGRQPFRGNAISAHTGSADTFFTATLISDSNDLAITVFSNTTYTTVEKPCIELLQNLLNLALSN